MKPHFLCELADCQRVKEGSGPYCATHALSLRKMARDLSKVKEKKPLKRSYSKPSDTLKGELQQVFNRWIRHRDKDKSCIYCNQPIYDGMVAAHYLPVSTSEAIRFDDRNVHGAHTHCNGEDNRDLIYFGMAAREGLETMAELCKLAKSLRKFTREELQDKIDHYTKLLTP